MILELGAEALEFGRSSWRAIQAAGGDELVRAVESDPSRRSQLGESVLGPLGAFDIDPWGSPEELEAAAALCRSVGYWGVPYPVEARLGRPRGGRFDALVVVAEAAPAAAGEGLRLRWAAAGLDGVLYSATPRAGGDQPRRSAFVCPLALEAVGTAQPLEVALALVLPCWTLLGMLDRAVALAGQHVLGRRQFDQPLASFQGVQFQLTEAEVERLGVEELAKYALWSLQTGRPEAVDDALALRLAAIEAAETVFRVAHQLHGAIGFCDETPLSWLSRYSVPIRRLPLGASATRSELTARIGGRGLTGLYSPPASP